MSLPMLPSHDRWNTPEELNAIADEAKEQPPPPEGGIPRQWVPGWIRWPIRALVLPLVLLDLGAQWIVKKWIKPPYCEEGHCYQRGNCCYYIIMPAPRGPLSALFYFWNTQINGFYARRKDPVDDNGKKMMVMGCRYLRKDGRCGAGRLHGGSSPDAKLCDPPFQYGLCFFWKV